MYHLRPSGRLRILFFFVSVLISQQFSLAEKPTWARKATAFESKCREKEEWPKCRLVRIPSPDGRSTVEVFYTQPFKDNETIRDTKVASLRLRLADGQVRETTLPDGFQTIDLLWAPDSKAFFVNGGDGGGYWGFWVYVYRVNDPKLDPIGLTAEAQRDMVKSFPPCKAALLDRTECESMEKDPAYNMSGIDWADSSAIVVMAEVPCAGSMGGIMCQVVGYELEVGTGNIRKRMAAPEFKKLWQKSMAFTFHIPDPPNYEPEK